jgi:hypothetical protein
MNDEFVYTMCEKKKILYAIKHQRDKQSAFSQLFCTHTNNNQDRKRLMSDIHINCLLSMDTRSCNHFFCQYRRGQ